METKEAEQQTKQRRGVITGEEGGPIELEQAASWTANHRHRHSKGATISQFFGQVILNRILQQDGCLGIRIYYANSQHLSGWQKFFVAIGNFFIKVVANAEGEQRFVIAGVTETGDDMLPEDMKGEAAVSTGEKTYKLMARAADNSLGDQSMPCPGSVGCPSNALSGTTV
jgi:hypothetical protein